MVAWMASLLRSFQHAFAGIAWALRTQRNLRLHALATVAVVVLGGVVNLADWEWVAIGLCIALVWMAELFNTAIEVLCDRLTREPDEQIRRVKDTAAGAVLVTAIVAAIVALIIFL